MQLLLIQIFLVCGLVSTAGAKACMTTCAQTSSSCCYNGPNKVLVDCCDAPGGECTLTGICCPKGHDACSTECCEPGQTCCNGKCCDTTSGKECVKGTGGYNDRCLDNKCKVYNRKCDYTLQKCCGGVCCGGRHDKLKDITCCKNSDGTDITGAFCKTPQLCDSKGKCVYDACYDLDPSTNANNTLCCGPLGSTTSGHWCPSDSTCCKFLGSFTGGCCLPGSHCVASGSGCATDIPTTTTTKATPLYYVKP